MRFFATKTSLPPGVVEKHRKVRWGAIRQPWPRCCAKWARHKEGSPRSREWPGFSRTKKMSFIYPPGKQHIPPKGKGTSSSKVPWEGKMLVLRRVIKSSPKKKVGSTFLHHPEIFFNHSATILATQKQEEVASTNKKTAKKSFVPPLNIYLRVTGKVPAENWVIWAEFFFCSGFVCGRKKMELPKPFGEKNNKLNYPPEN